MDESDKDAPEASGAAPRPQMPIGGMVRDPREIKTNPSLTRFLRERLATAVIGSLVAIGVLRPRTAAGDLGPRSWKGLSAFVGAIFAILFVWTSIHIVQPGNVAVPVTFGHSGKPLSAGLHITLPFTTAYSLSTRTQNYTMTNTPSGQKGTDIAVPVLGRDGGAASVSATVLYRIDPTRATDIYTHLGRGYGTAIVRPSARSCIRTVFTQYPVVQANTNSWGQVESDVTLCMKQKLLPVGLLLQDFQLRDVTLSTPVQTAVNLKVAAQQNFEQQQFDLLTAEQKADITRVQAEATADQKEILACGGTEETVQQNGQTVQEVVPNPANKCVPAQFSQADLEYAYIQALQAIGTSGTNPTTLLLGGSSATPLITLPTAGSGTATTTPATTVTGH